MIDLAAIVSQVRQGMIPAHVYADPEIFAAERDRLFARSWMFLAHESEIPDPGDYVVRRVLADSFIVARDEAGVVRVMFNMCLHRGMQVCRAELGNASHFRCPYHAWTYRNDGRLAGLPFHEEAYGGEDGFARAGQTLLPAPSMGTHNGLIFISLDPDAPALADYLGDFAFYLDFYTRQSPAGLELRGPQRWRIKANWKIGAENFAGDSYHTPHTHASVVDIGLFREPKASKRKEGALYQAGPGAGTTYKLPARRRVRRSAPLRGLPGRDDPGHGGGLVGPAAGAGRRQRIHALGRDPVPQPELRAQLAADRRGRDRGPVHLAAPVAAGQRARDRGPVLVRGGRGRAGRLQAQVVHRLPDVLRQLRHVRAGRRGELGVDHRHGRRVDGPAADPEQPDGSDLRRQAGQAAAGHVRRSRRGLPGLRRVRPAALARPVGRLPLPGTLR
jgi:phenylpropionate dioxygenase-like ring-hydroxylating dioxygenase large terminal subunit